MEKAIYLKLLLLTFLVTIPFIKEKGASLYRPTIFLSVVYFFEYGVPVLYMMISPETYQYVFFFNIKILNSSLTFCILVFSFFLVGYYLPEYNKHLKQFIVFVNKLPNISDYTIEVKNLRALLIWILILGWIARIIIFKSGLYGLVETSGQVGQHSNFHQYTNLLTVFSIFPLIGLALLFVEWLNSGKKNLLILSLLYLAAEVAYAIPTGSKERVIMPMIILLVIYSLKKKLPVIAFTLFLFFTIFFIFPFSSIYRNMIYSGDLIDNLQYAFGLYIRLITNFNSDALKLLLYNIFGERLNNALVVARIVEKTPKIWNFLYGQTYLQFFISIIPRVLWPGKPIIAGFYNDFGRDYGFLYPTDYSTSIDITWIGEMFLNCGWYGMIIGFFYGLLYRALYTYFMRNGKLTVLSVILYAFVLYYMIRGEVFVATFGALLKLGLTVFIISYPFLKKVKA